MAEIIVDIGDSLVETIGCEFKGELVRCKECKHRDPEDKKCDHGMQSYPFPRRDDDYCSYGAREGE